MKIKKILSVALTAALIGSSSVLAVSAKTSAPDNTYNYVALGDSIAAGYGVGSSDDTTSKALDPALILSQDLIDNPVKEAYAAVFGEHLKALAEEKGIESTTTNLSSTAYRAEDVSATILTEGYKGAVAEFILGKGTSEVLANYHDLYSKYLPQADLVSIQLGGNDIVMAVLYPMSTSENAIFRAISTSMALVLFGCDSKTAIGGGLMILQENKDSLSYQDLSEVAAYFADVVKNAEQYVENAAQNVSGVVDAVREVNSGTDIALLGMYNPYGNSLICEGTNYDLCTVITNIFTRAAEEICGCPLETPDVELVDDADLEEKAEDSTEHLTELSRLSKTMQVIRNYPKMISSVIKEKITKLLAIVKEEISYPLQYLTAGKNVDPQMKLLNEKLSAMAEEKGLTFVDVYNISNENNLDPHPTAKGHQEIASIMEEVLADVVAEGMAADKVPEPLENVSTIKSDTIKLGEKLKVRGAAKGGTGDYQYAFYYKKATSEKWTRVHDYSDVRAVNIIPAKAVDYDIMVKVRDNAGEVSTKTFTLAVTK